MPKSGSAFSGTRLIVIVFALLFLVIAVLQFHWFSTSPWMSIRLAPAFQMARGLPIYPSPSGGPYLATLYGYVSPLFYTPLAWISDADWAVSAAGIWTVLWVVGAGFWILRRDLKARTQRGELRPREQWFLLALMVLSTWAISSLRYSLWEVHADAPAHLCVLLACLALLRFQETSKTVWLVLAGVACGTAPWAKQLIVFPLLGAAIWLWRVRGVKAVLGFGSVALMAGLIWMGIGCLIFGRETLLFNLWTVPAAQPWQIHTTEAPVPVRNAEGKWMALSILLTKEVVWDYGPACLALVVVAVVLSKQRRAEGLSFLQSHATFGLLALTALCAMPGLVLGLVKEGGAVNSASFFTYPAILALFVAAATLIPHWRTASYLRPLSALSLAALAVLAAGNINMRMRFWFWPSHRELQDFMQSHPGEVYCPLDPLVHLLAEKKAAPALDILYSLDIAGYKVSREQFNESLPSRPKVKYVVYHPMVPSSKYIVELFPEHSAHIFMGELSGFQVYEQPKARFIR